MKSRFEQLKEATATAVDAAKRGVSSSQVIAAKIGAAAVDAGISAKNRVDETLDSDEAKQAIADAKKVAVQISDSASKQVQKFAGEVASVAKKANENHKEVADKVETVSMGLGITSGVVAGAAVLAAPTGLSAFGVAIGLTSAPLVVTAAPVIGGAAAVVGAVSGCAYFYSKWKTKREEQKPATDQISELLPESKGE
jgi:hypothetical protein